MKDMHQIGAEDKKRESARSALREWSKAIFFAVIFAVFIRTFVVQAFAIPSGSMENTLQVGDHLLISKFLYGIKVPFTDDRIMKIRDPKRGDVVVFEYPADRSKDFIKRIVGTPGDRIKIIDKRVYVNGILYADSHESHRDSAVLPGYASKRDNLEEFTVPADSFFVMGDNRDNSYDSRFWGFVDAKDIRGMALIKYWSWDSNASSVRWGNIGRLID